jgi:hypothetical protein
VGLHFNLYFAWWCALCPMLTGSRSSFIPY